MAGTQEGALAINRARVKVTAADAASIARALEMAAVVLEPDEVSQRQLFKKLMPQIKVLRNKGHSLRQVWGTLQAVGLRLELSTVKQYYLEFLEETTEACAKESARLVETMKALDEVDAKDQEQRKQSLVAQAAQWRRQLEATASPAPIEALMTQRMGGRVINAPPIQPSIHDDFGLGHLGGGALEVQPVETVAAPNGAAVPQTPVKNTPFSIKPIQQTSAESAVPPMAATTSPKKPAKWLDAGSVGGVELEDVANAKASSVLICLTEPGSRDLVLDIEQERRTPRGTPHGEAFWSEAVLEHPIVEGLMLTKLQRLFGGRLLFSRDGKQETETMREKTGRQNWNGPKQFGGASQSRTAETFVEFKPLSS